MKRICAACKLPFQEENLIVITRQDHLSLTERNGTGFTYRPPINTNDVIYMCEKCYFSTMGIKKFSTKK